MAALSALTTRTVAGCRSTLAAAVVATAVAAGHRAAVRTRRRKATTTGIRATAFGRGHRFTRAVFAVRIRLRRARRTFAAGLAGAASGAIRAGRRAFARVLARVAAVRTFARIFGLRAPGIGATAAAGTLTGVLTTLAGARRLRSRILRHGGHREKTRAKRGENDGTGTGHRASLSGRTPPKRRRVLGSTLGTPGGFHVAHRC